MTPTLRIYTRPPGVRLEPSHFKFALSLMALDLGRRALRSWRRRDITEMAYGGHSAVTRSLHRGLRNLGIDFTLNRNFSVKKSCRLVVVLAGSETLEWALWLAKKTRITSLLVGPNVTTLPSELGGAFTESSIRKILVPSQWVANLYQKDMPEIAKKLAVWSAGVDEEFWNGRQASHDSRRLVRCCVYVKNASASEISSVRQVCRSLGWKTSLIRYGAHSRRLFRKTLAKSSFLIYLGGSESQGLAFFESWSMGVPTFVRSNYDQGVPPRFRETLGTIDEEVYCPYLTISTGAFWGNLDELRTTLVNYSSTNFDPRAWILENATETVSARNFLTLVGKALPHAGAIL